MPFIKVRKPGVFGEAFLGSSAYELVEVDDNGVPLAEKKIMQREKPMTIKTTQPRPREYTSREKRTPGVTPPKIGNGIRAAAPGYSKPFDYHQWNAIRKKRK